MEWSRNQQVALSKVDRWLKDPTAPQVFHLFGYAGTGKTTLARHFAEGVSGQVMFGAFTGKAAHVLQSKGCVGATTIHKMIYHSRDKNTELLVRLSDTLEKLVHDLKGEGATDAVLNNHPKVNELKQDIKKLEENAHEPFFVLNTDSDVKRASLVVIDECSMVDAKMGSDLLSFGTKVLVLGDPAQLPPVGGAGYFTEGVEPDVMLHEIHRQAQESPIIRMATNVRGERPLPLGDWGDGCWVHPQGHKIDQERILAYDQVIVGKNATRRMTNTRFRTMNNYPGKLPVVGDKIVCLKNNHELGLLNGAIFHVTGVDGIMDKKVHMSITPEDSITSIDVAAHEHYFLGTENDLPWFEKGEAQSFDFGYALTCHKAQGSQWRDICVFDQSGIFRQDRWKWLYTAITRASESVTIVRM